MLKGYANEIYAFFVKPVYVEIEQKEATNLDDLLRINNYLLLIVT